VRFVSVTNGDAGHHAMARAALALRRRREAERVAAILGVEYEILDNPDGELEPTVERRFEMIRLIRRFRPDLVLTHRLEDYHPDHRATSRLVFDSAYMVTVPLVCPEAPHLRVDPVLGFLWDGFSRPQPFRPDVAVAVDEVMALKWDALDAHESQFYEWLPYNRGRDSTVPQDRLARRRWLEEEWSPELLRMTDACRERLIADRGASRARAVRFAETFEIGEHGRRPSAEELRELFPGDSAPDRQAVPSARMP
jgi:LmbE family N-acetylglucosaminyl deacetylase